MIRTSDCAIERFHRDLRLSDIDESPRRIQQRVIVRNMIREARR